ncbi:MAG: hypothetical protein ACTSQE_10310, partial [Candidatus Heimdallarchaeaceae archaeon]
MALNWYLENIDMKSQRWLEKYFSSEDFFSEYQFKQKLDQSWEKIKEDIPARIQPLIAYVLMAYDEREKIEQLYDEYGSIEIFPYYLTILGLKRELYRAQSLIVSIDIHELKETFIYSRVVYLLSIARLYSILFKYDYAYENIREGKKLIDEAKSKNNLEPNKMLSMLNVFYFEVLGYLNYRYRKNEKAKECYHKALEIMEREKIKDSYMLGVLHNSLGNCYMFEDSISEALLHFKLSCSFYKNENIARGVFVCEGNIATIQMRLGNFKEALEKLKEIKIQLNKNSEPRNIAIINKEIMKCLIELMNYDEALKYLKENLELLKSYYIKQDEVYLSAIEFAAILKQFDVADNLLEQYIENILQDKENYSYHNAAFQIFSGIVEQEKGNFYDAEQFLRKGVDISRKISHIPLYLYGLKYLALLLLKKFQLKSSESIIEELEEICEECVITLRKHSNVFFRIKFQLLLAQIYIFRQKPKLAEHIFELTLKLCRDYNITSYIPKIEQELELLQTIENKNQIAKLSQIRKSELSQFTKSIKSVGLAENLEYDFKTFESDKLVNLLIIHPSGLPIYSYQFKSGENIDERQLLISGLLKAIQTFSDGLIRKKGEFKMIEFEEFIILLEMREEFFVALFTEDFSYLLKERLILFSESV